MARLSFRGQDVDVNVDVSRLAREHPPLGDVRNKMILETGDVARVDQYLSHRLAAAFGKFGLDYMGEMSARIDRIFDIRNDLANSLDATLRGETVSIEALRQKFAQLDAELNQLQPPTTAVKQAAALEAPRDLPAQTRPADAPPPAMGGGGRGSHPPDHLTALAQTEKVLDGLHVVESQTAAPGLRARIAELAQRSPEQAQSLLRAIGKLLRPDNTHEFQGIEHFLNQGGSIHALRRLLSAQEQFDSPRPDWTSDLHFGLRMVRQFDGEAVRGLDGMLSNSRYSASTVLRIFHNCQGAPGLAPGIFASLARFQDNATIHRVIGFLATQSNPQDFKAVQGQLLTANQLQDRYPDAQLRFEEPTLTADGQRRADVVVERQWGLLPIRAEVKFFTTLDSIDAGVRTQLARDLLADADARRSHVRDFGVIEPPLAGTLLRFDRVNLVKDLRRRLRREPTDADIKNAIKKRLAEVFTEHEAMLRRELGAEFEAYKAAFESMAFVELY